MNKLKQIMMDNHFTESGADLYIDIKENYGELLEYYNPWMGNFGFTKEVAQDLMPIIMAFIEKYPAYVLLYAKEGDEEEALEWWLTDTLE